MSRYFVQPRPAIARASDDDWVPIGNSWHVPMVADHEAADTGLLDAHGNAIMRAPNPIGFGRDGEW
ncbi:hypothetical protein [Sphingobium yanoikuyae]|uniref:hypothetical protein n=1 Tax=Sphingobium yanoikuyae TaxID=13690 RepID=UPI002FDCC5A7